MAFALMDDQIHGHPKFARAGLEAIGLWALGLSYCSAYLTDGRIPQEVAERLAGSKLDRLAQRLVTCGGPGKPGLWDTAEDGWQMHDYLDWNPSRDVVLEKRQIERDRKAKGRKVQGRDDSGRITSARIPLGRPSGSEPDSGSGPTGSHAHAHAPSEEDQSHAGARVGEPKPATSPIVDAWRRITGNIVANPHHTMDMVVLLRRAADEEGCDPADYITAFVEWAKDCPPARRPQLAPHKLVENFAAVQEWRRGDRKPTVGERAAGGARRHNDGIGAQPATKEEDY